MTESYSNDLVLKRLIQQSRAIQGYLSFTPTQLEHAVGGWSQGLAEIPRGEWAAAIEAAMAAYESGPFNPAYVRKLYYKTHPLPEIDEASAISAMKHLALEVLAWLDAPAKQNILGPIAEWIKKRPAPTWRSWEKKVIDAVESEAQDRATRV